MWAYILRRSLYSLFVIWGAVTIIFAIVRLVPGDPVSLQLGPTASEEQIESAREELGFNDPIYVQYARFMADAVRLDFGESIRLGGPAMAHVIERLPVSITLALAATFVAVAVGLPLGIAAGLKPGSIYDRTISVFALVGQSLPTFWVGLMLILVFAGTLRLLPSAGAGSLSSLILPSVTLALPFMSIVARLARGGLLEVANEPYIQTARAKGLAEWRVIIEHALRNMLVPLVTVVGLQMGLLLGGAVVVEIVFSWPGVGRLLVDAIEGRDYALVQATAAVIAAAFVFLNLVVDILYAYLDPRIRLGE